MSDTFGGVVEGGWKAERRWREGGEKVERRWREGWIGLIG
jgi:hypothetical protein